MRGKRSDDGERTPVAAKALQAATRGQISRVDALPVAGLFPDAIRLAGDFAVTSFGVDSHRSRGRTFPSAVFPGILGARPRILSHHRSDHAPGRDPGPGEQLGI